MAARLLKIAVLLTAFVAFTGAAAANEYLDDAKRLIAGGNLRAARIQLKNAIEAEPKNMEAHYRLAEVDLGLGDAVAAAQQAKAALDGGFDADKAAPLLARSNLALGKYQDVLTSFSPDQGSPARRAQILVARGDAQRALHDLDAARKSFQTAQKLAPQSPQPLLAEAGLLLSSPHPDAAGPLLDRALALAPQLPQALIGKSELSARKGDLPGALGFLNQAVAKNPDFLPARIDRAEVLLDLDRKAEAQADIDAVLASHPDSAAAVYLRAVLYAKEKKFQQAEADLDRVSAFLGTAPHGYYVAAVVYDNLHQLSQAEDAAQRYVARFPSDPMGLTLLGRIALESGRPAAAVDALTKAERAGSIDPQTLDLLGRAELQAGDPGKAMAAFEAAVKRAPKNASLHYLLGISHLRAGDQINAVDELTRSLDLAPSAPAGAVLVLTDIAAGNYKGATDAIVALEKAEPNTPIPGNLTGLVKLAQFDLAGARTAFAAVAAKYPDFAPARLNLARIAELRGHADEARELLGAVLARQPTNAQALTRFVSLELQAGTGDKALAAAERAHATAPDNAAIAAGLVDLYIRLGKKNRALTLARTEPGGHDRRDLPLVAARARAEVAAGSLGDAAETYRRLIAVDGNAIAARRGLAAVLLASGDGNGARAAIDAALRASPLNQQLVEDRIAIDLKTKGADAALAWAAAYGKQHPDLPSAAALAGDVMLGAGHSDKALAAYRQAYRAAPSSLLALRLYRVLNATGKRDQGAAVLRAWLAQHPGDLAVAEQLGSADILARQDDEARKTLEAIVAKQPQNAVALNNLAWLYHLTGDPRAQLLAERAYALAPEVPEIAGTLGWILTREGRAADAVGLLQQASAPPAASPTTKYHLAVALDNSGQRDAAQKILASLVGAGPNFVEKPAAERLLATLSKR